MPWKSEVRFLSNACVQVAQASRFPFFSQSVQGRPTIRSYLATNGRCRHSHHHGVFRDGLSVTAGHGHARPSSDYSSLLQASSRPAHQWPHRRRPEPVQSRRVRATPTAPTLIQSILAAGPVQANVPAGPSPAGPFSSLQLAATGQANIEAAWWFVPSLAHLTRRKTASGRWWRRRRWWWSRW